MLNKPNKLASKLKAVDFAIVETALYLDAYPKCREALKLYSSLCKEREDLIKEYEAVAGPLNIFGNANCETWKWVDTPWPWQADCM